MADRRTFGCSHVVTVMIVVFLLINGVWIGDLLQLIIWFRSCKFKNMAFFIEPVPLISSLLFLLPSTFPCLVLFSSMIASF